MKKYIIIISLFSLLFACNTKPQIDENNKLNADLTTLFNKALLTGVQTRSLDGANYTPDMTEINAIIEQIIDENGIDVSEYYNGEEPPEEIIGDMYAILQWIEANGTSAFYEKTLSLCEGELSFEEVIADQNLLINEKIGLTVGLGLFENGEPSQAADNFDACIEVYDNDMFVCYTAREFGYLLSYSNIIAVIFSGKVQDKAEEMYNLCASGARHKLTICMAN